MDILSGILVTVLFIMYSLLWKVKRISLVKNLGIDPEVLHKSKSNLQRFMGSIFNLMKYYTILVIIAHTINLQFYSLFSRFESLNYPKIKYLGFAIGIGGLCVVPPIVKTRIKKNKLCSFPCLI